jgi:hypothetical protein
MGRPGQLEQQEAMDLRALQEPLEATEPLEPQGRLEAMAQLEQLGPELLAPQVLLGLVLLDLRALLVRLEQAQLEQLAKLEQPDLLGLREPLVLAPRAQLD